jgi:hypothetical protein
MNPVGDWRSLAGGGRSSSRRHGPFTLIVILPTNNQLILPTNNQLLDPSLDPHSARGAELLARWGRLHMTRSVRRIERTR